MYIYFLCASLSLHVVLVVCVYVFVVVVLALTVGVFCVISLYLYVVFSQECVGLFCFVFIIQKCNVFMELERLLYRMLVTFYCDIENSVCKHSLTVGTFETVEEADRAKEALNGADIYSGCCTLKVDWGKVCTVQYYNCAVVRYQQ